MPDTTNFKLTKPTDVEFYDVNVSNDNMDKIDAALTDQSAALTAGGTGTAITISAPSLSLRSGLKFTFVAAADNGAVATTIKLNDAAAKNLYKPGGTQAPKLISGKAYDVWYNGTSFFIKASAEGDAVVGHVLAGKVFSNDNDTGLVGAMVDRGSVGTVSLTAEAQEYTIPEGYHNGLGKVKAAITGLIASVLKVGATVGGVNGTYTSDANASAGHILSTITAYVNGAKITGSMPNRGSVGTVNLTAEAQEYTIAEGYHNGLGKVKAAIAGLVAGVIKAGTTVGGIVGTYTSDATAIASQILSGVTAYVNGSKVTGTMPNQGAWGSSIGPNGSVAIPAGYHNGSGVVNQSIATKGAQTFTPGTANQTIGAGQYLTGDQVIQGSANLVPSKIRKGNIIFGVTGTYYGSAAISLSAFNLLSSKDTRALTLQNYYQTAAVLSTQGIEGTARFTATFYGNNGTCYLQLLRNGSVVNVSAVSIPDTGRWNANVDSAVADGDVFTFQVYSTNTSNQVESCTINGKIDGLFSFN